MSIPVATKNAALDGITFTHVSLHSDYPGATGANEISGVTRQAVSVGDAIGGIRTAAKVDFIVPPCTIRWIGWWNGTVFVVGTPHGGATPRNFVALGSNDACVSPAHGYADTQEIVFWGGSAPGGLTTGSIYYVRDATTDTFKVAATSGGDAIDLTSSASSGCWVSAIAPKTYAVDSTHSVTVGTFLVPD